jgi:hypothetical protein
VVPPFVMMPKTHVASAELRELRGAADDPWPPHTSSEPSFRGPPNHTSNFMFGVPCRSWCMEPEIQPIPTLSPNAEKRLSLALGESGFRHLSVEPARP